nr:hypothetical protein [uncultured Sphingomonas sp.]
MPTIVGTAGNDNLTGGHDADLIEARGGDDLANAGGGDDTIDGGAGADR